MVDIGRWVFIAGLIIALIIGFTSGVPSSTFLTILIVLGLIVGLLNITEEEVHGFLLASIALLLVGNANLQNLPLLGNQLQHSFSNLVLFIAPAALVVAIKEVFLLASKK